MATPRKRPEDKVKTGRPSSYKPEYCQRVMEMGKEGLSIAQMAARLEVAKATLWDWAQSHPEFSVALADARTFAQSWWENAGQTGIFAEKFNAQAWKFIVANRFKEEYAERRIQEVSGPDGAPVQVETKSLDVSRLSREEREALKRTLLIALGEDNV